MKKLLFYETKTGKFPLKDWLRELKDVQARQRIQDRLFRITIGNFGDHKSVGGGVQELRMTFGSGYRIYYAEDGDTIVVLLCGGDKKTQPKDIKQALGFWSDYQLRKNEDDHGKPS